MSNPSEKSPEEILRIYKDTPIALTTWEEGGETRIIISSKWVDDEEGRAQLVETLKAMLGEEYPILATPDLLMLPAGMNLQMLGENTNKQGGEMTEPIDTEIKLDHEGFVIVEDMCGPVVLYKEPYGDRIFVRSLLHIVQTVYDAVWEGTKKSCVVEVALYDEDTVKVRMLSQSYWGPHDIKAYVNRFINLKHPYEEVIDDAAN